MARHDGPLTSEDIGEMLETSPVVVRRTLAGLRERGIVSSEKGHGGGWRLERGLETISMLDVYEALGEPALFALGPANENATCLVGQAVDARLGESFRAATAELRRELRGTTLAQIADDFEVRAAAVKRAGERSGR